MTAPAVLLVLLAGCGGPSAGSTPLAGSPASTPPSTPAPALLEEAKPVAPDPVVRSNASHGSTIPASSPVQVDAVHAAVRAVTLTGRGVEVPGVLTDGTWRTTGPLSPGTQYRAVVQLDALTGPTTRSFTFNTAPSTRRLIVNVTPDDQAVVGVAQPLALTFNSAVTAKQEVVDRLRLGVTPQTEGAWRWVSDRELRWRPREYWAPGTTVSLVADLRGLDLGGGVYAVNPFEQSFTIGRAQELRIDAKKKRATFFRDGEPVRNIPVSLGKPGFETRSGVKVIMERYRVKRMRSTETGESYDVKAPYALRLTLTGEFIHAAPWATGRLGRRNGSHGCTNVSLADGKWLFGQLQQGDPVVTVGTIRRMEPGNGFGDFNLTWEQWLQGATIPSASS